MGLPYYHFGLVMEQTLGHVTHSQNLARWLSDDQSVQPLWLNVLPQANDVWQKLPGVSFRSSLRAWELVRAVRKDTLDCLFYHPQGTALFSLGLMQRIPTVISLDATPINFYTIGTSYGYKPSGGGFERLKFEWYRRMFQRAAALVSWSHWAKESLVQGYGVVPDKVTVIPPGVDLYDWRSTVKEVKRSGPLRLLFVGGDFARKGGHVLLQAFHQGLSDRCTLDVVTKDELIRSEGAVRVHRGLTPNSLRLRQLYAEADLFVFPTFADFTPIAVMEAMASGLPVVATNVGALSEEVEDGTNGLLVPPNDPSAIVKVVCALADNPRKLVEMGAASRLRAERYFDEKRNYQALVDVLKQCVDRQRSGKTDSKLCLK